MDKPLLLFYRCSEADQILEELPGEWPHQKVQSLKALDAYADRFDEVVILAPLSRGSKFALWAEEHQQFTVMLVLQGEEQDYPTHVADWIVPPWNGLELRRRFLTQHKRWQEISFMKRERSRLKEELITHQQTADRLLKLSEELKKAKNEVEKLSLTDPLTSLNNRRFFDMQLSRDVTHTNRYETPLSMYIIDIDDFKSINDQYGHPMGDKVLKKLGKIIADCLRETDWAARYGGEEFCVVMPMTNLAGALSGARRMLVRIEKDLSLIKERKITASIGLSNYIPKRMKKDDMIRHADQALYHSKRNGKNKITYYNPTDKEYEELAI